MILDDIMPLTKSSSKSRLTSKGTSPIRCPGRVAKRITGHADVGQALLTIKSLGKLPTGSQVVATRQNLHSLLIIFNAFKDDAEASNEALKCIANALLLIESARSTFVHKEVGGGDAVIDLLEVCGSPSTPTYTVLLTMARKRHPLSGYSSVHGSSSSRQCRWPRQPTTSDI